ncbi:hypothetical protein CYD30_29130 [Kosakonia cowanii]|nr:hypothetical protein CYD30_29130 [Kosakonia cowanii]
MNFRDFSNDNIEVKTILSEARLISWSYSDQFLKINLISDDDDEIELRVVTDTIISEKMSDKDFLNTCHIEIVDVREKLQVQNGFYFPRDDFSEVMKLKELSFFYGKKASFIYCISFVGYKRFLTFPVKELSDIKFYIQ